jgi:hypothetical protein
MIHYRATTNSCCSPHWSSGAGRRSVASAPFLMAASLPSGILRRAHPLTPHLFHLLERHAQRQPRHSIPIAASYSRHILQAQFNGFYRKDPAQLSSIFSASSTPGPPDRTLIQSGQEVGGIQQIRGNPARRHFARPVRDQRDICTTFEHRSLLADQPPAANRCNVRKVATGAVVAHKAINVLSRSFKRSRVYLPSCSRSACATILWQLSLGPRRSACCTFA